MKFSIEGDASVTRIKDGELEKATEQNGSGNLVQQDVADKWRKRY